MRASQTIASYDKIAPDYRERWQERTVLRRAQDLFVTLLPAGALVLDVGCGPGFDGPPLRDQGLRVVGVDLSWGMMAAGRERYQGHFVQADMRHLPFASKEADAIWAAASLLHLRRRNFVPTLQQFHQILRPDGLLYISLKEGVGSEWDADFCGMPAPRFFTYWKGEELDEKLRLAGFATVAGWKDGERQVWLNRIARRSG